MKLTFQQNRFLINCLKILIISIILNFNINSSAQVISENVNYTILNLLSYHVMDVKGGSNASGTRVWQYRINLTNAQKFRFEDAGNGLYYIRTYSNKYLSLKYNIESAERSSTTSGDSLSRILNNFYLIQDTKYKSTTFSGISFTTPDSNRQLWKLNPIHSDKKDYYVIESAAFRRFCLMPVSRESGVRIKLSPYGEDYSKVWLIYKYRKPNQGLNTSNSFQWKTVSGVHEGSPLETGKDFTLYNIKKQKYLEYKDRNSSIDLDWFNDMNNSDSWFEISRIPEVLKYGQVVKLAFGTRRTDPYLIFEETTTGVDLNWIDYNSTESAQWKVCGYNEGETVLIGDIFALVNIRSNDTLIYCSYQTTGIDLEWSGKCNPAPQTGYGKFQIYNCHNEQISVHLWVKDYTLNVWTDYGVFGSQWIETSCPGNQPPRDLELESDHLYQLIAVNESSGCNGRPDMINSSCWKLQSAIIRGRMNGSAYILTVN